MRRENQYRVNVLYLTAFFVLSCFAVCAQQSLKFLRLGIEQGLSDDGITSITEDSKGFIWIGTNQGLNRFDGYTFKVYKVRPEKKFSLKSNKILSIFEDSHKTLWVGTDGGGLHYYDSLVDDFHPVTINASSTRENRISVILEDLDKNLWLGNLGYPGGIGMYDHGKQHFTPYDYKDTKIITKNSLDKIQAIRSIELDKDNNLWIGTFFDGVYKFNLRTKQFTKFPDTNLHNKKVMTVYADDDGIIWLGTFEGGLCRLDPSNGTFKNYTLSRGNKYSIASNRVSSILPHKPGYLWIATSGGLCLFDVQKERFYTSSNNPSDPKSLSDDFLTVLFKDRNGLLWVGSQMNGVNMLETSRYKFHSMVTTTSHYNDGITNNHINALLEDRSGSLWIGTFGGGLFRQQKPLKGRGILSSNFINYIYEGNPMKSKINTNGISALMEDSQENIWIGHGSGGINIYNPDQNEFKSIRAIPEDITTLSVNQILSFFEDSQGRIWVGTFTGGVNIVDKTSKKVIRHFDSVSGKKSLGGSNTRVIYQDRSNNIWLGHSNVGGFDRYDETNENFIHHTVKDSDGNIILGRHSITSFWDDGQGQLWVSSNNGVFGLKTNQDTVYNSAEGRVTIQNFKHFNERNGLISNEVFGMLPDDHGKLWISTNNGISCIDTNSGEIINYDESDGLVKGKFNPGSYLKSTSGHFLFGGVNGLSIFHPDSIVKNENPPALYITDFQLFNSSVPIGEQNDGRFSLTSSLQTIRKIELPYQLNFLSFEFSALNYIAAHKNNYAYKLEGLHADWIFSGNNRTATFTNLDPGTYTFRVKGSNNDGVWNEQGASMIITILPPPWKTWWAYMLYSLSLCILVFVARREIVNRERLRAKAKMKELETTKLQEVDQLKSHFFANISHEFRTPLTLLLGPIENRLAQTTDATDKAELSIMKRNASRLLVLVNQLLDLSRLEAGTLKLACTYSSLTAFIKSISSQFSSMASSKKIHFSLVGEPDIMLYFDSDKIEKIITNLLANAFKFTEEHGTIELRITTREATEKFKNGFVEITVKDTGTGIEPQHLSKIFDRFYQADASATRSYEGSGIGLSLTKELVELHYGNIRVTSETGKGSCFIIELPIGNAHLKQSEIAESDLQSQTITFPVNSDNVTSYPKKDLSDSRVRVLIVEDNSDLRSYLTNILSETYSIFEAVDGEQGETVAIENIPDLIISDLMMPKKDGLELCKALKVNEKTSHIPVILLTARADLESRLEGLQTGADDYIAKPFDARELHVRIHNLIEIRKKIQIKFSNKLNLVDSEIKADSIEDRFLKNVKATIENHINDTTFSVEQLADELAMSSIQVYRKLKALSGYTPNELIRNIRLEHAAALLAQRAGNVSEIAYQCGFNNLSYFAKCFKEKFGVSPSEY